MSEQCRREGHALNSRTLACERCGYDAYNPEVFRQALRRLRDNAGGTSDRPTTWDGLPMTWCEACEAWARPDRACPKRSAVADD